MLGSNYDVGLGLTPVDLAAAASTGKRLSMAGVRGVGVLFLGSAGAAAEPPVLTLRQHTALTGGTSADWDTVSEYWVKKETTLDDDEVWARSTQTADAVVTGTAQMEQMIYFYVRPVNLGSGKKYMSVDVGDVGAGAQLGCILYFLDGVSDRGAPQTMFPPLR